MAHRHEWREWQNGQETVNRRFYEMHCSPTRQQAGGRGRGRAGHLLGQVRRGGQRWVSGGSSIYLTRGRALMPTYPCPWRGLLSNGPFKIPDKKKERGFTPRKTTSIMPDHWNSWWTVINLIPWNYCWPDSLIGVKRCIVSLHKCANYSWKNILNLQKMFLTKFTTHLGAIFAYISNPSS